MKRQVGIALCMSIIALDVLRVFAACNFVRVATLGSAQITIGWPLDSTIRYWVEDTFIPSGIRSEFSSAASTWDSQCNRLGLMQDFVHLPGITHGQVVPITNNWVGEDSAAAHTLPYGFPVMTGFRVEINFKSFKRSGWTTASSCPIPSNLISARRVALHEMGHAIGLEHNKNCPDNVMETPINRGCVHLALGNADIETAQALYNCTTMFQVTLDFGATCVPDFDPAADISDFRINSGVATWTARHEWDTKEYVLEGCDDLRGAGVELAVEPPSLGIHVVPLQAAQFLYVRLVEIEASGRRIAHAYDTVSKTLRSPAELIASIAEQIDIAKVGKSNGSTAESPALGLRTKLVTQHPTVVVYTTSVLKSAVLTDVAPFWEERGQLVEVVDVGATFPAGTELEGIKASIAAYAQNGTKYFHLVGDWEDDYPFAMWSSNGYWQSKYDAYHKNGLIRTESNRAVGGIPTHRYPDHEAGSKNTAQQVPYIYTDQWYADTDEDDVPDVVVTRWPFGEPSEVSAAADRLPSAHSVSYTTQRALFLVGEAQPNGPGSDLVTAAMADEVEDRLLEFNAQALPITMLESNYPNVDDRNYATAWALNQIRPDLIVGLATFSSEKHPCRFFVKEQCTDPPSPPGWRMESLQSDYMARLVLAASCSAANWTSPTYICHINGPDFPMEVVCEEFLKNDGAGTLAWVGPTTGSLQGANYTIAYYLIEELMTNPYRPMAESWLSAMQRAYAVASEEYVPTLQSYAFLGDPLSPYRRLPDSSAIGKARAISGSEAVMPSAVAAGCPQGDLGAVVIDVNVGKDDVLSQLPLNALTLTQAEGDLSAFFPEQAAIAVDSLPDLLPPSQNFPNGYHRATFTVRSFGGCETGSALVSLYGIPLVEATTKVRSPDMNASGSVDVVDFALFGLGGFPRNPAPDDCGDFNNDAKVDLADFGTFGAHNNHHHGQALAKTDLSVSSAGVVLHFTEEYPTATSHRLYVDVDVSGFAEVEAALFALVAGNERLTFVEWSKTENSLGTIMFAPVPVGETQQLYFGALTSESFAGTVSRIGRLTFDVSGLSSLEIAESDFQMVTGDVLLESTAENPVVARMAGVLDRAIDPTMTRIFHNRLEQNFPNPFNPSTTLVFSIKDAVNVSLTIYDVSGRRVRELINERRERGAYRIVWDGRNDAGEAVASGVYLCRLVAGSFTSTKKMTMLK